MLSAGGRHAGSVFSVGPDRLVIDELGRAGEAQQLDITITRTTRIIESQRNPAGSSAQDSFTDKTISLAEVKTGDYVVVDASRQEAKLVAESITVTLRQETQVVRSHPGDSAPPATTGTVSVVPLVEPLKQLATPPLPATAPAQPLAPYDAEDPRGVIEWLLYPASGRTR
jgi:hypothetical protein